LILMSALMLAGSTVWLTVSLLGRVLMRRRLPARPWVDHCLLRMQSLLHPLLRHSAGLRRRLHAARGQQPPALQFLVHTGTFSPLLCMFG
jgi:hypothetical protein